MIEIIFGKLLCLETHVHIPCANCYPVIALQIFDFLISRK